jgi:transcriptional regulator with XRE-family HTH domain
MPGIVHHLWFKRYGCDDIFFQWLDTVQNMTSIGPRLRRLRKEAGLNQQQLAAAAGVTQSMISDYESKGVMFQADVLARMAQALGVDMETIMQGGSVADQGEMALISAYRTMSEESRQTLLTTARAFAQVPAVAQKKRSNGA